MCVRTKKLDLNIKSKILAFQNSLGQVVTPVSDSYDERNRKEHQFLLQSGT